MEPRLRFEGVGRCVPKEERLIESVPARLEGREGMLGENERGGTPCSWARVRVAS